VYPFSAATQEGIPALKDALWLLLKEENQGSTVIQGNE
jgi:hypothetical protein